jgi:hypothetical protein
MALNKEVHPYVDPLKVSALNIDGNANVGGSLTVNGATLSGQVVEVFYNNSVGFSGYTAYTGTNGLIQYFTASATASGPVNITATPTLTLNSTMAVGNVLSIVLIVTNGATAYYPTAWRIDGVTVTPKWLGGTAPSSGNALSTDVYALNIFKVANGTFTVLGVQNKYA